MLPHNLIYIHNNIILVKIMNEKYTKILAEINALEEIVLNAEDQEQVIWDQIPPLDLEVQSDWEDNKGTLVNVNKLVDIDDEDEEQETREQLEKALTAKITTYRFVVKSCKCSKFLSVIEQSVYNFSHNNTEYCPYCSDTSESHHFVLYNEEAVEGSAQAENIFNEFLNDKTIEITEVNLKLFKKCYNL
jgi:hypothetical protein